MAALCQCQTRVSFQNAIIQIKLPFSLCERNRQKSCIGQLTRDLQNQISVEKEPLHHRILEVREFAFGGYYL